jgi:hypothetical protein
MLDARRQDISSSENRVGKGNLGRWSERGTAEASGNVGGTGKVDSCDVDLDGNFV